MAECVHAQPAEEVEIALAVDVVDVHALAARDGHRITGIGIQQEFLFAIDYLLVGGHSNDLSKTSL